MYRALYSRNRTFVMILGCGCSKSTEPTAQSSHYWNLIQLSYVASSPRLSNRITFPLLFRMHPSETVFNVVKFALLKYYGWEKVATLHQHFDLFALPTSDFQRDASEHGVEIIAAESVSQDLSIQLANLKERKVRIIIGNFYESMARKVFCEAYKLGMYGQNYVWIIPGKHTMNLIQSTSEFWSIYKDYVGGEYEDLSGYAEAPFAYDSAWVIAWTLHKAEIMLREKDSSLSIANFTYDKKGYAELFYDLMNRTNFVGVSGHVQFNEVGDRKGLMKLEQNQGGLETEVAFYDPSRSPGKRLSWTSSVIWQGDGPPDDMLKMDEVIMSVSPYLFIVATCFAIVGVGIAIFFLAFNIKYRKKRFIKMSSPNVNNLILFGGILAYVSLIPLGVDSFLVPVNIVDWMCKLKLWCLATAFSVAFGAMFMKTWRVHKIFTRKSRQKTVT
ncbi:Gamma-aminobutyric acid type B receptor subunit 1 [Holothuria leucospilota]|uniref:Gamma-aminobutyric acid type B receptor subunit 2 n=1 Tax=Holothuria leucospilota TaxID=206669 RepID=A0A9Q0YCS7_HOLLE|nr:Gamma-aminobutyric acid type B receptor subunit 1 [Holothuria leucospilota]